MTDINTYRKKETDIHTDRQKERKKETDIQTDRKKGKKHILIQKERKTKKVENNNGRS